MKSWQLVVWFLTALLSGSMTVQSAAVEPVTGTDDAAAAVGNGVESERLVYDQRQSGKYNIHISIKDVAIIEMSQNEVEELDGDDYYYDEGDLTVKPLPLWMKNQTTSTTPASITTTNGLQNLGTTLYSPNLMADIAATEAANAQANISASTYATTNENKPPSVVVLATSSPQHNSPSSTHIPPVSAGSTELQGRSTNDLPIRGIFESLLLPPTGQHYKGLKGAARSTLLPRVWQQQQQKIDNVDLMDHEAAAAEMPPAAADSKVYKFKMRRAHKDGDLVGTGAGVAAVYPRPMHLLAPCRHNHLRDANGNCRSRRTSPSSPSLFKRLFKMLLTLPFAATEHELESGSEE